MTPIEKVRTFITAYLYDDDDGKTAELLRELDGKVLVPVEPTEEMLKCACSTDLSNIWYASPVGLRITPEMFIAECYKAMIASYLPEERK